MQHIYEMLAMQLSCNMILMQRKHRAPSMNPDTNLNSRWEVGGRVGWEWDVGFGR